MVAIQPGRAPSPNRTYDYDRLVSIAVFEAEPTGNGNAQIAAMSGRRPVVKGSFEATVNVSGAVMSTAC